MWNTIGAETLRALFASRDLPRVFSIRVSTRGNINIIHRLNTRNITCNLWFIWYLKVKMNNDATSGGKTKVVGGGTRTNIVEYCVKSSSDKIYT